MPFDWSVFLVGFRSRPNSIDSEIREVESSRRADVTMNKIYKYIKELIPSIQSQVTTHFGLSASPTKFKRASQSWCMKLILNTCNSYCTTCRQILVYSLFIFHWLWSSQVALAADGAHDSENCHTKGRNTKRAHIYAPVDCEDHAQGPATPWRRGNSLPAF